jgi:hypothetical protein
MQKDPGHCKHHKTFLLFIVPPASVGKAKQTKISQWLTRASTYSLIAAQSEPFQLHAENSNFAVNIMEDLRVYLSLFFSPTKLIYKIRKTNHSSKLPNELSVALKSWSLLWSFLVLLKFCTIRHVPPSPLVLDFSSLLSREWRVYVFWDLW